MTFEETPTLNNIVKRLVTQDVIIASLCKLLVENNVFSQKELDNQIAEIINELNQETANLKDQILPYYGPTGKA